ncbi:MAG: hypothetical protein M1831_003806 [Alyxoria varia]|nr:MAG: hypothetical protein M1831_003806 [Alyxoria varia]
MSFSYSPQAPSAIQFGPGLKNKRKQFHCVLVRPNIGTNALSSPPVEYDDDIHYDTIPSVPGASTATRIEAFTPSPLWSPIEDYSGKPSISPLATLDINFRQMGLSVVDKRVLSTSRGTTRSSSKRLKTSHGYFDCAFGPRSHSPAQTTPLEQTPPLSPCGGGGEDSFSSASTISEPADISLHSPARHEQVATELTPGSTSLDGIQRTRLDPPAAEQATVGGSQPSNREQTQMASAESSLAQGPMSWLASALGSLETAMNPTMESSRHLYALSQTLPTPSAPGVFPELINTIRSRLLDKPMTWINVVHAVPKTFTLADVPSSAPTTPTFPHSDTNHATTKVFDSAVASIDYGSVEAPGSGSMLAPGELHLSVVERYLPPASTQEFARLFDPSGPSLLIDRMKELAFDGGCLLFIYPTNKGAQTFMNDFVGPILDPLLRTRMVINSLPGQFIASLGRSPSVGELPDWETMQEKLLGLCKELSETSNSQDTRPSANAGRSFSVINASKQELSLDGSAWKQWWCEQERPRLKEVIKEYATRPTSFRRPDETPLDPSVLLMDIMNAVSSRSSPEPTSKVEVGVFVIQSTQ